MARIQLMRKEENPGVFFPYSDRDGAALRKFGFRKVLSAEVRQPRNPDHHALVFALARCTLENLPEGNEWSKLYIRNPHTAPYAFIKAMMLEIGEYDERMDIHGEVYRTPKSIAFESMDEMAFEPISEAMFKICAHMLKIPVDMLCKNYKDYL